MGERVVELVSRAQEWEKKEQQKKKKKKEEREEGEIESCVMEPKLSGGEATKEKGTENRGKRDSVS